MSSCLFYLYVFGGSAGAWNPEPWVCQAELHTHSLTVIFIQLVVFNLLFFQRFCLFLVFLILPKSFPQAGGRNTKYRQGHFLLEG